MDWFLSAANNATSRAQSALECVNKHTDLNYSESSAGEFCRTMAEAHNAVVEPRFVEFADSDKRNPLLDFIRDVRRSFVRTFFRTRNLILNGLWPTSPWNLCVAVCLISLCMGSGSSRLEPLNIKLWSLGDYLFIPKGTPYFLKMLLIATILGLVYFILVLILRRYLLRMLLQFHPWLYEQPKKQGLSTLIWGMAVRVVFGSHPLLNSCQLSLPRLPVPPLSQTISLFLDSIQHVVSQEEMSKLKQQAKEFEMTIGPQAQRLLWLKSWWSSNYVTDWWEKYVYLMNRSPLSINSNYYILDHAFWRPTHLQISRASSAIHMTVRLKQMLDREELIPLVIRNTIPLCMAQYEKAFASTRIPKEDIDELAHFEPSESKHVVVVRNGVYYKLDTYDTGGQLLSPGTIEKQLEWIINDSKLNEDESNDLASLTTMERTKWAKIRKEYFTKGINKDSIEIIDKAAFMVYLEDRVFDTFTEQGKFLLHGDGKTLWFDKSLNLVFFGDGRMGGNAEHSWGDAPVVAHVMEFKMTTEILENVYDSNGKCKSVPNFVQQGVRQPSRLLWDSPPSLSNHIETATKAAELVNDDLDLIVTVHDNFGKGFIKKCKISPDAYIQLALQLAYYRDNSKFALAYESSMTRLFLRGRTETVRSLTQETATFVRAMVSDGYTREEKIKLLQSAGNQHQKKYRDCMSGKGCDRHLFALYIAIKGMGKESEFLHNALTLPWTLSTSQTPQQQMANTPSVNSIEHRDKACPGGGFGPVSDSGYGVSYMVPEDTRIFFHISSKKSCPHTDSERFKNRIFQAMAEMRSLFVDDDQ